MVRAGEILKKERLRKKLTIEEVETATKIRKKFIKALEDSETDDLPPSPFVKGFIKNYSDFLGLKSEVLLALFRREEKENKKEILPKGLISPLNQSIFKITPSLAVAFFAGFFLFLFSAYLFREYRAFFEGPLLTIESPKDDFFTQEEKMEVKGRTEKEAALIINGQPVNLETDGSFSAVLNLSPGTNTVKIVSRNKFGRERTAVRTVHRQPR